MTEPDWVRVAIDVGQFVVTGAVGFYVWIADRDRARASTLREMEIEADERFDAIGERLARIEERTSARDPAQCGLHMQRLATLEAHVEHAPNHEDIKRAHARMDTLSEGFAELRGAIRRVESQLDRIADHLLNHPSHGGGAA